MVWLDFGALPAFLAVPALLLVRALEDRQAVRVLRAFPANRSGRPAPVARLYPDPTRGFPPPPA